AVLRGALPGPEPLRPDDLARGRRDPPLLGPHRPRVPREGARAAGGDGRQPAGLRGGGHPARAARPDAVAADVRGPGGADLGRAAHLRRPGLASRRSVSQTVPRGPPRCRQSGSRVRPWLSAASRCAWVESPLPAKAARAASWTRPSSPRSARAITVEP